MPRPTDLSSILGIGAAFALPLGACANPEGQASRQKLLDQLRDVRRLCGLPEAALTLRDDGRAHLNPAPGTPYETVGCTLHELEKAGIPPEKIGFVAEPPEDSQK